MAALLREKWTHGDLNAYPSEPGYKRDDCEIQVIVGVGSRNNTAFYLNAAEARAFAARLVQAANACDAAATAEGSAA